MKTLTAILLSAAMHCPPVHERARPPPAAADRVGGRESFLIQPPSSKRTQMLTAVFPFLLPRNIECELPARLRSLADDLEVIRRGDAPRADVLAGAPLIVDWHATLSPLGLRLAGFVAGHPVLGNRPAMTSQVWVVDPAGKWVRTLNRFYKLGIPADGNSLERLRNAGRGDAPTGGGHE
jgi:hypothetical protein